MSLIILTPASYWLAHVVTSDDPAGTLGSFCIVDGPHGGNTVLEISSIPRSLALQFLGSLSDNAHYGNLQLRMERRHLRNAQPFFATRPKESSLWDYLHHCSGCQGRSLCDYCFDDTDYYLHAFAISNA